MMPRAKDEAAGRTQLSIAIEKAIAVIDAREKASKMKKNNADAYRTRVNGLRTLIGGDEDAGLLQVAQIIGAVNRSV